MKPLTRIATGIDTHPIGDSLACNESAWHIDTSRQHTIRTLAETQSIFLREAAATQTTQHLPTIDIHESRLAPHAWQFPEAVLLCQALAASLGVELGRALLARLPPGGNVLPHHDPGAYYAIRDRYHLVIASEPGGSIVGAVDQEVDMKSGELWWLANKERHWARNLSAADRIHLIFDVLPHRKERGMNEPNPDTGPNGTSPSPANEENRP